MSPQGDARDLWALAHGDLTHVDPIATNAKTPSIEEVREAVELDRGFSAPVACVLARISYRQLDYWARTNLITPSLNIARGSGSRRKYSNDDVRLLCIIRQMLDFGVQLQVVRELILKMDVMPKIGDILVFSAEVDNRTRGGHALVNCTGVLIIADDEDPQPLLEKIRETPCFVMVVR